MSNLIRFKPGENYIREMQFFTGGNTGSFFDLTGYKVFFTAKSGTDYVDSDAVIQKSFVQADAGSAVSGLITFQLNGSETQLFSPGSWAFDFKMISGTGPTAASNYTSGTSPTLIVDPRVTYSGAF